MTETRTVWRTPKAGAISSLSLVVEPLAILAPNEIRIDVRAVGLNFADIFALTGLYSATPQSSFIPGLEFSGVVSALGCDAKTDLVVGDRVFGCTRFGGYVDCIDIPPQFCRKIPETWSFAEAAAFPVQGLTAFYGLTDLGALQAGQTVLIHSAAGGVGLQAMAMAKHLGAIPIGTVSGEHKKTQLAKLGFHDVIVRGKNFAAQLEAQLAGRPLHLVLDGIGGQIQKQSFASLAPTGRLVVFGAAEFTPGDKPNWFTLAWRYLRRPRYDVMDMISSNRSVLAFNLIWLWQSQALFDRLLLNCQALNLAAPLVGHEFDFKDAHQAIECLRSGQSVGKVVLLVPEPKTA